VTNCGILRVWMFVVSVAFCGLSRIGWAQGTGSATSPNENVASAPSALSEGVVAGDEVEVVSVPDDPEPAGIRVQ